MTGLELVSSKFVKKLEFTSTPTNEGMYATVETIEVAATLSENVTIDGPNPVVLLEVGANTRAMTYVPSESTSTSWEFQYTVVATDRDDDGVEVPRNGLRGYADADLSYPDIVDDADRPSHSVTLCLSW
jgi:hypothetical protein